MTTTVFYKRKQKSSGKVLANFAADQTYKLSQKDHTLSCSYHLVFLHKLSQHEISGQLVQLVIQFSHLLQLFELEY